MRRLTDHPVLSAADPTEVEFSFDGEPMRGNEGEVVSSALFANGVQVFSVHPVGDAPRGIFCANGQCAQCTVVIDGYPVKSCVEPLRAGMDIRTLRELPELPRDDTPPGPERRLSERCDVLVVGGGPSGLTATIELAQLGFSVTLVDDKDRLGGKLLLQTHKFFGSLEDCYAGTRGVDIAAKLEKAVRAFPNVTVHTDASVVGIYKDHKIGVVIGGRRYLLIDFDGLVVGTGAREKSLVFPGNDLPGVYGAGAFQTLVNRDLVRAADRVLIVGSGNVGLIAAYHALQAGIQVVGIVDILPQVSGYKVHGDKIRRLGVPVHLSHTVLGAEGDGALQRVTIAQVNEHFEPDLHSARTYAVDTLLIAVGLSPVDEFFDQAERFGFTVVKTGDADEIAEASSAMFGGRVAGLELARMLGRDVEIDPELDEKAQLLKSRPGRVLEREPPDLSEELRPVFHCTQEIPCNPCTSLCRHQSVKLVGSLGNLMDLPRLEGQCNACGVCASICPGLAITLARHTTEGTAEVVVPHEFVPHFVVGDSVDLTDCEGAGLQSAEVLKIKRYKKHKTWMVTCSVDRAVAADVAGIRIQAPEVSEPLPDPSPSFLPEDGLVCRCERITLGQVVDYIQDHDIRDVNQLKQLRVGMGACGGKNCPGLLPRVFGRAGVDWGQVTRGTTRPLSVEVPISVLLNENSGGEG